MPSSIQVMGVKSATCLSRAAVTIPTITRASPKEPHNHNIAGSVRIFINAVISHLLVCYLNPIVSVYSTPQEGQKETLIEPVHGGDYAFGQDAVNGLGY